MKKYKLQSYDSVPESEYCLMTSESKSRLQVRAYF